MRRPAPALVIRRVRPEDLDAVVDISRASFKSSWSPELFRRELTHAWSTTLLAERRDSANSYRALGFIIYWVVHDELHILNVACHPEDRRSGVGRALMDAALEEAQTRGLTTATLEVRKSNTAAIALYDSYGFKRVGLRPNYYVDEGEDAVVMTLDLTAHSFGDDNGGGFG